MPDGYKYANILLKLYLRSLKNEGKLMFNERIPYNSTILAQVTRHSVGDVEKAIEVFKHLELIEVLDNGAIFITDIQNFIGRSSTEADRKRDYRLRIENEKQKELGQMSDKCPDKSPPEREIDIEREKDIEIEEEKRISSAATLLENYFGSITQFMMEDVEYYKNHFDEFEQILELAIDITRQRSVKNWKYTKSILNDWKGHNLKTVEDIKHHENRSKVNKYKNQVTHELPPEQEEQYKNLGF